jgi:hypothetical protein
MLSIQRRHLLAGGLSSALLLLSRAGLGAPENSLLALFPDPAAARAIGKAFLRDYPGEADAAHLAARLPRRHRLHMAISADFAAGKTVMVEGWVLSRTEARLCALVALTGGQAEMTPHAG